MSRDSKIRFFLILLIVGLLVIVTILATDRVAKTDLNNVNKTIAALTKEVRELKSMPAPQDGYTPIKGIDYVDGANGSNGKNGSNGLNGTNALSTHTEKTIIKETPVEGKAGENGRDAPLLEIRLNPITSDLETKLSNNTFWEILIPCNKLLVGCSTSGL